MAFWEYCFLFAVSAILSTLFCILWIPVLKKIHAGQNILSYVKEHKAKDGTPTMGGLAFIAGAVFSTLLFVKKWNRTFVVTLVVGIAFMAVGLLDDLLKKKRKENLGLTATQKIVFQLFVASFASLYAVRSGLTAVTIPFFNLSFDLGWWYFLLSLLVFLATVNCVNLTDGLDGLASGVCVPFFLFFGALIGLNGDVELSKLSVAISASLVGYLLFNTPTATVFMGDTGSLALGGFAGCLGVFSGNLLYIAIVGFPFVLSGASVIMQVVYFKLTGGKRIFKMTPIHHHFQQLGFKESKISYAYFAVTLILSAICLGFAVL